MLDAFIIEEIKRRERLRQERERPAAEVPLPVSDERPPRKSENNGQSDDRPDRGVVIVDMSV